MAKRTRKMKRDAVSPFRDKIWNLFRETAKGMDGADVVMALKQAGEEIWAVGHRRHLQQHEPSGRRTTRQRLRYYVADGGLHQAERNSAGP